MDEWERNLEKKYEEEIIKCAKLEYRLDTLVEAYMNNDFDEIKKNIERYIEYRKENNN